VLGTVYGAVRARVLTVFAAHAPLVWSAVLPSRERLVL
jgi:hypothetical protein